VSEKFDPAPFDKHAQNQDQALKAEREPMIASDPVSASQPAPGDDAPEGTAGTGEAICPECEGTGKVDGKTCENCDGSGKVVQGIGGA
jgi:hypothetical protein